MIKNAKQKPQIYYGLHFCPGVAEYKEPGQEPYRIFINENTIRDMNPTFAGCPVYVQHVDEVDLGNIQAEADGYVVESFYNAADGKTWCKFVAVSDRAHEAIRTGWKLSNAYFPKQLSAGGEWNGVEYAKEITQGEFEHLAIVPNPRYAESVIMTPDEFKLYNANKQIELLKIANSNETQKEKKSMLKFFKKSTVENGADLEAMTVVLPKSKREITLSQLVNEKDEYELKMKEPQMANGEHHVEVAGKKMTVNELVEKHNAMCQEMDEMKAKKDDAGDGDEAAEKKHDADDADAALEEKKKDDDGDADMNSEEPKKNEEEKKKDEDDTKAKKNANFKKLKNAELDALKNVERSPFEMSEDKIARGKVRYGSN